MPLTSSSTFSPHILLAPQVIYPLSSNEDESVSPLQPDEDPWKLTTSNCSSHIEVPLRRDWMNRSSNPAITSKILRDLSNQSEKSNDTKSTAHTDAWRACESDLINETKHQLESVDAPELHCGASTGYHLVGILSQAQVINIQKHEKDKRSRFPPSCLSSEYLKRCILTPLEERGCQFTIFKENDCEFCKCSFAGPSAKDEQIEHGQYQSPYEITSRGAVSTSGDQAENRSDKGAITSAELEEMSRISFEIANIE
ncbi:uncharacterized protein I206_103445 [Kwoniella pini CBS 10737]|uniref:Uncharacterized protein n=1 Tax=Kwoniella pini CBS 10737 TaxID=1296096 RepID=A0A1B9I9Q5_9TREE|nr:uncharacterized protein I206_01552 [Kwoniella pini CBS 10737]OCF52266.1 hypothetical protein I206_01552 [Kwoniella pini CBS 10737]